MRTVRRRKLPQDVIELRGQARAGLPVVWQLLKARPVVQVNEQEIAILWTPRCSTRLSAVTVGSGKRMQKLTCTGLAHLAAHAAAAAGRS